MMLNPAILVMTKVCRWQWETSTSTPWRESMTLTQTKLFHRYWIKTSRNLPVNQNFYFIGNTFLNVCLFVCFCQPSKSRSRSWNDSSAPTVPSIWSKDFKLACPSATPPETASPAGRPPNTKGKERVIQLDGLRLPCRELQVKRPREGELIRRGSIFCMLHLV